MINNLLYALVQEEVTIYNGDDFEYAEAIEVPVDEYPADYTPVIASSRGGMGLLITLLIVAILALFLIIRVGRKSSKKGCNNTNQVDDFKPVKNHQRFNSFYVDDDGTIVRGHKDTAGILSSSAVIESHNEQKEALSLIKESADAGVAEAQYYLGLCYEQGTVVPKDLEEAKKWYRIAAEQSFPQAKYRLGKLLMEDKIKHL